MPKTWSWSRCLLKLSRISLIRFVKHQKVSASVSAKHISHSKTSHPRSHLLNISSVVQISNQHSCFMSRQNKHKTKKNSHKTTTMSRWRSLSWNETAFHKIPLAFFTVWISAAQSKWHTTDECTGLSSSDSLYSYQRSLVSRASNGFLCASTQKA